MMIMLYVVDSTASRGWVGQPIIWLVLNAIEDLNYDLLVGPWHSLKTNQLSGTLRLLPWQPAEDGLAKPSSSHIYRIWFWILASHSQRPEYDNHPIFNILDFEYASAYSKWYSSFKFPAIRFWKVFAILQMMGWPTHPLEAAMAAAPAFQRTD